MKTRTRFTLFFITILTFIIGFSLVQYFINKHRTTDIINETLLQLNTVTNKTLESKAEVIRYTINDYTYWDEMVSYIGHPTDSWFDENINASFIKSLKVSGIWVYNKNFNLIKDTCNPLSFNVLKIIDKHLFKELNVKRYLHFYKKTENEVTEVFAATVHFSNDPLKKGEPQGYLFLAKLWDKEYLSGLEKLSGCSVSYKKTKDNLALGYNNSFLYQPVNLYSWNGQNEGSLLFSRVNNMSRFLNQYSAEIIEITLILGVLIIILIYIFFRKWFNRPLSSIRNIFDKEDYNELEVLKKSGREFGEIAFLIEKYIAQQTDLIKAKLKAEESDRLKSAFLSNISHEIRTPMNAIMGFSALLKNENNNPQLIKEFSHIIYENSVVLLELMHDIIDVARLEIGEMSLESHEFSLSNLMESISNDYATKARDKFLEFYIIRPDNKEEYFIVSDESRLRQAINNVLNNSIKFTKTGKITINYGYEKAGFVVSISDTGIGIEKEQLEKIFEPFGKAELTLSKRYSGTGLGLSITKAIIQMIGGEVSIQSQPGLGSTFYIKIPTNLIIKKPTVLETNTSTK